MYLDTPLPQVWYKVDKKSISGYFQSPTGLRTVQNPFDLDSPEVTYSNIKVRVRYRVCSAWQSPSGRVIAQEAANLDVPICRLPAVLYPKSRLLVRGRTQARLPRAGWMLHRLSLPRQAFTISSLSTACAKGAAEASTLRGSSRSHGSYGTHVITGACLSLGSINTPVVTSSQRNKSRRLLPTFLLSLKDCTSTPKHHYTTMSFHASASEIHLDNGHILKACVRRADGQEVDSEIDLNNCIGNDNGKGTRRAHYGCCVLGKADSYIPKGYFAWGGQNFSHTAEDISLSIEGDASVPVLRAGLRDMEGNLVHRDINLAERISNEDGRLVFSKFKQIECIDH